MPKNLQPYYNYVYKKPIKARKKALKLFCCFFIFILITTLNNCGILTKITQKQIVVFKQSYYYALILNQDDCKYSLSELKKLGCACNNFSNNIILNIYTNIDTCEKVQQSLNNNYLKCNTIKITLKSICVSKNTAIQNLNILKNSLSFYKTTLNNLLLYCEEFDKGQTTLMNIKSNCNNIKNELKKHINNLTLVNEALAKKLQIFLTHCAKLIDNVIDCHESSASYYLKEQTANFMLNYLKYIKS